MKSSIQRILGKRLAGWLAHSCDEVMDLLKQWRRQLHFNFRTWDPRGDLPSYRNYYPDGMSPDGELRQLYQQWVRGNRLNNNGDASRFIALILNLRQLNDEGIQGDFAELGVWKGNSAALLAAFAAKANRRLFLFDTFSGFDERNLSGIDANKAPEFADTSVDYVKETVGHMDLTTYIQGFFPESLTDEARERTFALAHIDCDLYEPMKEALQFFYARMPRGGMLILHDYSSGCWDGAKRAVDEFVGSSGEFVSLWPDKSGTAMIRKTH
jgi:Macrocin-O-methyltransferase (TylF)